MRKRDEYPNNKSLRARSESVYSGFRSCYQVLSNIKEFGLPLMQDGKAKDAIVKQITDALADGEVAMQALIGEAGE